MRIKQLAIFILSAATIISCSQQEKTRQGSPKSPKKEMSQQLGSAVLWYQNAAEMRLSYYQSYQYAKLLLDKKVANTREVQKPMAVVLDIDETVLDNSPYEAMLIKTGQTYASDTWKEWTALAKAEALPGAKSFVEHAMEHDVEVFYISNRSVDELGPTLMNLRKYNFPNSDSTHVLLKKETSDKTQRREAVSQAYDIVVFIGDNLTDYSELYADRDAKMGKDLVDQNQDNLLNNFVMLPNPMYGEWEKAIYDNNYRQSDSTKLILRQKALKAY